MVNRSLIRLKIVQLLYSFYQNGGKNGGNRENELLFSLGKAYDLYFYLLELIVAVTRHGADVVRRKEELNRVAHKDEEVSHRFVDNRFVAQLDMNEQLNDFRKTKQIDWDVFSPYVRDLYTQIVQSDIYAEYMALEECDYAADKEVWRKIYKRIILKDTAIDDVLEEEDLYWNDDKEVVDTFVLKTIKRFDEKLGKKQPLLPEFREEEDKEFAIKLLKRSIMNDEYYRDLIARNVKNWEFNRLAYMDVLVMQVALAEMLSFPQIPVEVTINEYVDIAKRYSTPKSGSYVNGILDHVAKVLIKEGKLLKRFGESNKSSQD